MAQRGEVVELMDFSGGLNTRAPAGKIGDNQLADVLNWMPFEGTLRKRLGQRRFDSSGLPDAPFFLEKYEVTSGVKRLVAQCNTANQAGTTKSLFFYCAGDGVFYPIAWYNTGTATFTNGSPTVTLATGYGSANLRTPSEYWIRAEIGDDINWYPITAAGTSTVTLGLNFAGTGGAGKAYTIVKVYAQDIQGYKAGVFKDSIWICVDGDDMFRFDGTNAHAAGNLPPIANCTATNDGAGNVDAGVHRIVAIFEYGTSQTLGKSEPRLSDGIPVALEFTLPR